MSYDQASNLESGRQGGYSDDPDFQDLQRQLRSKVQTLLNSNRDLSKNVGVLGTKKDTPRLRERVHKTMETARNLCKDIAEGVKQLQTWDDLTVCRTLSEEKASQSQSQSR
jgi:syntaxin 7